MHNLFNLTVLGVSGVLLCFVFMFRLERFDFLEFNSPGRPHQQRRRLWVLSALVCFYGVLALFTLKSYYEAPRSVFSNADHHVIRNLGFSFTGQVILVDEASPREAVWGEQEGFLAARDQSDTTLVLEYRGLNTPLFLEDAGGNFHLVNSPFSVPIRETLAISWSDGITFRLNMEEKPKNRVRYSYSLTTGDSSYTNIEIPFSQRLKSGYPLSELLRREPVFAAAYDSVMSRLGRSLLVREVNEDPAADLLFFSDRRLGQARVLIDGQPVENDGRFGQRILPDNRHFYLGLPTAGTRRYRFLNSEKGKMALVKHPEYHYLYSDRSDSLQQLFITTSSRHVLLSSNRKGFLLNGPGHEEAKAHISGTLSYYCGDTEDKMLFRFLMEKQKNINLDEAIQFSAGDTLRVEPRDAGSNNLRWLLKIEDLKGTNRFHSGYYYGYIFMVIALCLISLFITPPGKRGPNLVIETSVYLFLIFILTVRSVLLWRATTFIPDEGVSYNTFELFRTRLFTINFLRYQLVATIAFFVIIILWKLFGERLSGFVARLWEVSGKRLVLPERVSRHFPFISFIVFIFSGYLLNFLLHALNILGSWERLANVLFPLLTYFSFDYLIQNHSLKAHQLTPFSGEGYWLSIFNWVFCFLSFAVFDAGFTIIFIIFTLLLLYMRWSAFRDHYHQHQAPESKIKALVWRCRPRLTGLVLAGFVGFNDRFISFAFRNVSLTVIIGGVILLCLVFWESRFSKKMKLAFSAVIIGVCSLVVYFAGPLQDRLAQHNRMLYRAEVLFKTADEVIELEEFQSGNDTRVLNAAQNQWLISYYNDKATWLPLSDNYFRLLPHFQRGSSYEFQISDLVAIRYLTSEHGHWLIILVILFTAFLLVISLQYTGNYNVPAKMRIAALVLLFTMAYAIWLTSSNRLVFVGQDFPMLSLNSALSLFLGFLITGFVIASAYNDNRYNPDKLSEEYHDRHLKGFRLESGKRILRMYFLPLLTLSTVILLLKKYDSEKFDLEGTMAKLELKFDGLNALFAEFQSGRSFSGPEDAVAGFDRYLRSGGQYSHWFEGEEDSFYRSAYESFRTRLIKNNSSENLIHIRQEADGTYIFGVNGFYYTTYNPDEYTKGWKGNLTTANRKDNFSLFNENGRSVFSTVDQVIPKDRIIPSSANNNIRISYLPASWTLKGEPVFLINKTLGQENINKSSFRIKDGGLQYTSNLSRYAFVVKPGDVLHLKSEESNGEDVTLRLTDKTPSYLAKNVWMNGKAKFFYPLEERFIWSYQFANFIKEATRDQKGQWQNDVDVTLDVELTDNITKDLKLYYARKRSAGEQGGGIVAMASDGSILALSDYSAGIPIHVDPNKMYKYHDFLEALYLKPDRKLERKIFGNQNLRLMHPGPGSTFKPLLYGAITSQFDLGWENLSFGGIGNYPVIVNQRGNTVIRHFGGERQGFKMVTGGPYGPHNGQKYLLNSTNSYNSMVLFLGSFDATALAGLFSDGRYLNRGLSAAPQRNFPILNYRGVNYHIRTLPEQWSNPRAVFHQGLWLNFNLPFTSEQKNSREGRLEQYIAGGINDEYLLTSTSSYKLWSQPDESFLYAVDRDKDLSNAIGNIAMGGFPIEVTPLKMAEMTARLFSLNAGLTASVMTNRAISSKPFSVGNWADEDELARFYVKNVFGPLFEVPRSGTIRRLNALSRELQGRGIYMYAKTGTISDGEGVQDKALTVVISRGPVHEVNRYTTARSLRENKFVVLYFSFKKEGGSWSSEAIGLLERTIRRTVESGSFQNFIQ